MQVLRKKQRRKREIELLSEQKVKTLFNERNQLKQKIETEPEWLSKGEPDGQVYNKS